MMPELRHSFEQLTKLLGELQNTLTQQQPIHWLPLNAQEQACSDSLSFLTELIGDLWYQSNQDGRETRARHGIVLVNADTLALINRINQQKDDFRKKVKLTRLELTKSEWLEEFSKLGQANLREALRQTGLSRVHLRQCYRHIPVLEQQPKTINFSWYVSGRSIRRLSLSAAEQALLALGEEKTHISLQLQKLRQLPIGSELAQMQSLAPVVRANVFYEGSRKAMNTALPIFILDTGKGLPKFNTIDLSPPEERSRKIRADLKVDPEPFLPSIRAHLYK